MLPSLTFKTTSLQFFENISVQISPNNSKLDIFEIYTKRAVGKCPRCTFLTIRKPKKSINKSGNSFGGHPVLLHIFKIKDNKQNILRNLLKHFLINISKCYSSSENNGIYSSPYSWIWHKLLTKTFYMFANDHTVVVFLFLNNRVL